jgi:NgoMIV restriction enzyme
LLPNFADVDNAESMRIAAGVLDALAVERELNPVVQQAPGGPLEQAVCDHLGGELARSHQDLEWLVGRGTVITGFDQYYLIRPDVTVGLGHVVTASGLSPLHAAISCKWTIRSDGVQNIRHECLQMIRQRRGGQPHLVTVTAEPLPSRLASIARGTGEVDAVYHIAYDAMAASVAASANPEQADAWREVTGQRRVLSYEFLPPHWRPGEPAWYTADVSPGGQNRPGGQHWRICGRADVGGDLRRGRRPGPRPGAGGVCP